MLLGIHEFSLIFLWKEDWQENLAHSILLEMWNLLFKFTSPVIFNFCVVPLGNQTMVFILCGHFLILVKRIWFLEMCSEALMFIIPSWLFLLMKSMLFIPKVEGAFLRASWIARSWSSVIPKGRLVLIVLMLLPISSYEVLRICVPWGNQPVLTIYFNMTIPSMVFT